MRLCWCITVREVNTSVCGTRFRNRSLCAVFGFAQFLVATVSLLQFLAYDIIIFDYGLMHRILGTNECVANYLDGGFMRSLWCIQHTCSLFLLMVAISCIRRPIWLIWPSLLMQSAYALGLGVLSMAIAPKLLEAFGGKVDARLAFQFAVFVFGFCLNWLFTFVLWHYYWYMEKITANVPPDAD